MAKRFIFGNGKHEHVKGDRSCPGCRWDYPNVCDCGGVMHIEYLPANKIIFIYYCDICKENDES